jgi:hypothetical protein
MTSLKSMQILLPLAGENRGFWMEGLRVAAEIPELTLDLHAAHGSVNFRKSRSRILP